jgi:glycosyl transferase family 25
LEAVKARPYKLTKGALGCALSHLKAYQKMLADNVDVALILEDDAILPKEINKLLTFIENNIRDKEAILLHYFNLFPEKQLLSHHEEIPLDNNYSLMYPVNFPLSGTAYVIKKETAFALSEIKLPIIAEADDWRHFYENGAVESLRCVYPKPVNLTYDYSQIQVQKNYNELPRLRQKFFKFVYENKVPPFYQMHRVFFSLREKYKPLIVVVHEPSPILGRINKV